MSMPSGKKILLVGFVIVLLIVIPVTVYLVHLQQSATTSIVPSTNLSFIPASQSTTVGNTISFDINMDPGTNQVSSVKLLISYDATKLATTGAGFTPNASVFSSVIDGPTYGPGTIAVTLSVGANQPTVQKPAKIGTITFQALAPTDTAPTQVTFGNQTQVLSGTSGNQFNQNVLSTTSPANVNITSAALPTPTPQPSVNLNQAKIATPSPTPISIIPTANASTPAAQLASGTGPVCTSFSLDRSSTGTVPYYVNFTLTGTDNDATITKVTFDFGDGQTQDLTASSGIGTNSVNVLQSHVYNSAGVFTATGTITDTNGTVSQVGNCSLTLTVTTSTSSAIAANPSPLPSTGPGQYVTIGIIGVAITIIGAVLMFAL